MDFIKNTILKENYTFFVGNENGFAVNGEHGLYNRDTRFLSRYIWHFPESTQTLVSYNPRPDKLELHHTDFDTHYQRVSIGRNVQISSSSFKDTLRFANTSLDEQSLELKLSLDSDFADLFEARGWHQVKRDIVKQIEDQSVTFTYLAEDQVEQSIRLSFSEAFELQKNEILFKLTLAPKESLVLGVDIQLNNPLETGAHNTICYENWRQQFDISLQIPTYQMVLNRAIDDLRALLLFDKAGTFPAAGIPWFVTAFGRDSLLTAFMMLPYSLDAAKGTLSYLGKHQAKTFDAFRNAQPGKILHEVRYGELTRLGKTPHGPYYGTVDATPLYIMLIHEVFKQTNDLDFLQELRPHWEAALNWMLKFGDLDGDTFLEFKGPEDSEGLSVQSWKDSGDSLSHADGSLAEGAIAVSEVQGYAYAAYKAAKEFYEALNNVSLAQKWQERAETLKSNFHNAFWLEDMKTYAMALDGKKQPLKVHNSDAGQLLWTGIVPDHIAPELVKTLMSDELWTGWGIRTLGKNEVRYNPVSYHNGSVWPHDTALIAGGMLKYGFIEEATLIAHALFDLAASQTDFRLAELVGGYTRSDAPPVPYPTACRPQAWDAAALIYLSKLLKQL